MRAPKPVTMYLAAHENEVLRCLDDLGASTTRHIADQVRFRYGHTNQMQNSYVLGILRYLERKGYVRRLDDEKPIARG